MGALVHICSGPLVWAMTLHLTQYAHLWRLNAQELLIWGLRAASLVWTLLGTILNLVFLEDAHTPRFLLPPADLCGLGVSCSHICWDKGCFIPAGPSLLAKPTGPGSDPLPPVSFASFPPKTCLCLLLPRSLEVQNCTPYLPTGSYLCMWFLVFPGFDLQHLCFP